jgi:UDPglucose 6-dehydrogenase
LSLVEATLNINDSQPNRIVDLAESLLGKLTGKRIAVLGLAFKPETDDVREAVSIKIISRLLERGAKVVAYDPIAAKNFMNVFKKQNIEYSKTARECIKDADCAVIVTEWKEFRKLSQDDYLSLMKYPALVDGRRIYRPEAYSKLHFKAIGLGK